MTNDLSPAEPVVWGVFQPVNGLDGRIKQHVRALGWYLHGAERQNMVGEQGRSQSYLVEPSFSLPAFHDFRDETHHWMDLVDYVCLTV